MPAAIRAAIAPFRQAKRALNSNPPRFVDEDLTWLSLSDIPEEFHKLSRFLPMIVLVPRSVIAEDTTPTKLAPNKSLNDPTDTRNVCLPIDAAKAWVKNSNATDTFAFSGVQGCFSTMELRRDGRPVTLTNKEFGTLAYLIKNPRRVISRDELLNEVWGYENYPCTRTVDTHILRLRKKLESEPAHPRHFHTVYSAGYKFLP